MKNKKLTGFKDTRGKILYVALEEFANKGFKEVSTREITKKAGVNLSSIKYHFGDKESLYRAAFIEPLKEQAIKVSELSLKENLSIEEKIRNILFLIAEPLKDGKEIEWCTKIRMRESIEKTSLIEDCENDFLKVFQLVCDSIQLEIPLIDEITLKRLSFSILSQIMFIFIGRDLIEKIEPNLLNDKQKIDAWVNKSVFYALKMIELERSVFVKENILRVI